jgi:hypothetical protein
MNALTTYGPITAGAIAVGVGVWHWIRTHRITPEQRERMRRERLSKIGRICDGTVIDLREISQNGNGVQRMLVYQYDVSGVTYEASQDITQLHNIEVLEGKFGVASSVRYDPHTPGKSIVISEWWTGLRN